MPLKAALIGVGRGLVRPAVAQVQLQDGVVRPRRLARRQEGHDQHQRDEDKEHHQGGEAAKEGEQEGSHAGSPRADALAGAKP